MTVAAVDAQQQVGLAPGEVAIQHFSAWAKANLKPTDCVALEATSNTWDLYDQLEPLVAEVTVANAHQVKLISSARVKTDKHDALVLAKLLAANLLPAVWVPPVSVRELRGLVAHRERFCRDRRAAKNRLHSVLHRHNLMLPAETRLAKRTSYGGKPSRSRTVSSYAFGMSCFIFTISTSSCTKWTLKSPA